MKTVRLQGNTVAEVIPEYAIPVEKWYGCDFAASCVEAPDEVDQQWVYDPDSGKFTSPDPTPEELEAALAEAKAARIQQSKADLEAYLEAHPLTWTDGETYSITQEKQNQLMGTIAAAQIDGQPPEWNTTGGVCRAWELTELCALAVAIKDRVKALVKYQQAKEVAMREAATLEELEGVNVDYDEVS